MNKSCRCCGKSEPEVTFYKHGPGKRYSMLDCGKCHNKKMSHSRRSRHYRVAYGVSDEEYESLVLSQDYKCAICLKQKPLHLDHNHTTGKVRGLLCGPCNMAIGTLGDSPESLQRAVDYLSW